MSKEATSREELDFSKLLQKLLEENVELELSNVEIKAEKLIVKRM
ncbi:MAG: hypothetical protein QXP91_07525 [Candidatus Methanomethylicia archaeon]